MVLRTWPTIDLHGPLHRFGIMDPFCGGTRATFLLASGDFAAAAEYNPAVFPLALSLAALTVRVLLGVTSGIWYHVGHHPQMRWPLFAAFVVALVLLGIPSTDARRTLGAAMDRRVNDRPVSRRSDLRLR